MNVVPSRPNSSAHRGQAARVMEVGGAGFLGSHLVDRLVDETDAVERVDVVDCLTSGSLSNLSEARTAGAGRLHIHTMDATSAEFASVVTRAAPTVIHVLAAFAHGRTDAMGSARSYAIVMSVLEAARVARVRKVVVTVPACRCTARCPCAISR